MQLGWRKKGVHNVIGECILKHPTGKSRRKLEKFVKWIVAKLVVRLWTGLSSSGFDIKISGTIFDITKCFKSKSQIWCYDKSLPQALCDTRIVFRVWRLLIISSVSILLHAMMKQSLRQIGCLPVIWERWAMHCSSRIRLVMTVFSARSVTSGRGNPLCSSDDQPIELQHGRRVYIQASLLNLIWRCKSTAIPGQTLRVPVGWDSYTLRQSAHEGGKVVSPTHRPPLPPQEILLVHISFRDWVDYRAIVRPEGLRQ